jgi:hypothetical protein
MRHRYLVFAHDHYYPDGGWHDFVDSFATLEVAEEVANETTGDYWHIVDLETKSIIAHGKKR